MCESYDMHLKSLTHMMPGTYIHALFHSYCQNESTARTEIITEQTKSLYGTNKQNKLRGP
jgi:hypothetical protein